MNLAIQRHSEAADEAVELLRKAGLANPVRLVKLIRDTISFFELNLTDMTVLTEAASGPYVVTPVIAALAGARRVIAVTRDSPFATVDEVRAQTRALETLCGVSNAVEIHVRRTPDVFAEADIVTNLGFVRPIDAEAVAAMRGTAVVPLMCEAWEFRPGDVDMAACQRKGISVIGTNEDFPGLEVFSYSGWLGLKMLFEAQIEVHKSKIVLISGDKFGEVIALQIARAGARVHHAQTLREIPELAWADVDCVIVADYTRHDMMIGPTGELTAVELAQLAPGVTVLQLAGWVDVASLRAAGLTVYPGSELGAHRMAQTLAGLGPRPVIELHTAGLKIGELASGNLATTSERDWRDLMQPLSS